MCRITRPAAVDQLLEQLRPAPAGTGTAGPAKKLALPGPAAEMAASLALGKHLNALRQPPVCRHGVRVDLDHCWDCGGDEGDDGS